MSTAHQERQKRKLHGGIKEAWHQGVCLHVVYGNERELVFMKQKLGELNALP